MSKTKKTKVYSFLSSGSYTLDYCPSTRDVILYDGIGTDEKKLYILKHFGDNPGDAHYWAKLFFGKLAQHHFGDIHKDIKGFLQEIADEDEERQIGTHN